MDPPSRFRGTRRERWKKGTMDGLVELTIDAHGGCERWGRFEHVSAHLRNGGVLWALKHQPGVIEDVNVRVAFTARVGIAPSVCKTPPADIVRTSPGGHRNDGRTRRRRAPHAPQLLRRSCPGDALGSFAARVLRRVCDVDLLEHVCVSKSRKEGTALHLEACNHCVRPHRPLHDAFAIGAGGHSPQQGRVERTDGTSGVPASPRRRLRGHAVVAVVQSADFWGSDNGSGRWRCDWAGNGCVLAQRQMCARAHVVRDVLGEQPV